MTKLESQINKLDKVQTVLIIALLLSILGAGIWLPIAWSKSHLTIWLYGFLAALLLLNIVQALSYIRAVANQKLEEYKTQLEETDRDRRIRELAEKTFADEIKEREDRVNVIIGVALFGLFMSSVWIVLAVFLDSISFRIAAAAAALVVNALIIKGSNKLGKKS